MADQAVSSSSQEVLKRKAETDRLLRNRLAAMEAASRQLESATQAFRAIDQDEKTYAAELMQRSMSNSRSRQPTPLELSSQTFSPASSRLLRSVAHSQDAIDVSHDKFQRTLAMRQARPELGAAPTRQELWNALVAQGFPAGVSTEEQEAADSAFTDELSNSSAKKLALQQETSDLLVTQLAALQLQEQEDDALVAKKLAAVKAARQQKEKEKKQLTPVPTEFKQQFQSILRRNDRLSLIAKFHGYSIKVKDIMTLRARTWLNDEAVAAFYKVLDAEDPTICSFNTFFMVTLQGPRGYVLVTSFFGLLVLGLVSRVTLGVFMG